MITALVMTTSSTPAARVARTAWPMPSRITLPPPNFASSPGVVRSRSMRMNSSVSARRTRSPLVGRKKGRAPASSTSVTRFSSPGSKRTAVPAGTLSRMPNACARSNRSVRLTSKKWKCEPTWMGRSAVLVNISSTARRPWFATTSPSPSTYSPGITPASFAQSLANRMVNGDELGAVGERALDLNFLDHLRHAFHHVVATEDAEPRRHPLRHGPPVADALEDLRGDERERLGVVELETASAAPPRDFGRGEDEQLLLLARSEVHRRAS